MLLYHEKQVAALCGVHCLNALLQGPYFSEVDLAQIGHELDALERAVLEQPSGTVSSSNLDESGMFSVQVLSKALAVWNLQAIPYDSQEIRSDPQFDPVKELAFLCNLQEHWFSIRKVDGSWWNFNSLYPAPEALSDFYLAAYLDSLKQQGYTIFVVRGPVPQGPPGSATELGGAGKWFSPEEAAAAHKDAQQSRQRGKVLNALENAFALAQQGGGQITLRSGRTLDAGGSGSHDTDPELTAAIAASLAAGLSQSSPGPSRPAAAAAGGSAGPPYAAVSGGDRSSFGLQEGSSGEMEDDPELAQALALSMEEANSQQQQQQAGSASPLQPSTSTGEGRGAAATAAVVVPEEPPEGGEGVMTLAVRLPSGARGMRRFLAGDTVGVVRAWAAQQLGLQGPQQLRLALQFPTQVLEDDAEQLQHAGVQDRSVLAVTQK